MYMKDQSSQNKKQFFLLGLAFGIGFLLIGGCTLLLMPWFRQLSDPAAQQALQEWIHSLGMAGWLFTLCIQILQIIVAFIPGEPVELLAGVLYGTWGGLATCLLGVLLASSTIFFSVRRFGYKLIRRLFGEDKLKEFDFLSNTEKVEAVTFVLFLIPGTPKDMLTYLAGVSRIKAADFLFISTFARIPSIITSTMMGATVSRGNWKLALVAFLLTAAIGFFGIFYKKKIMESLHRHSRKKRA